MHYRLWCVSRTLQFFTASACAGYYTIQDLEEEPWNRTQSGAWKPGVIRAGMRFNTEAA